MADWYYSVDMAQKGPVPEEEMINLLRSKVLGSATMVWKEGMEDWEPISDVAPHLLTAANEDPAVTQEPVPEGYARCSLCTKTVPANEIFEFEGQSVCQACKPELMARIREGRAVSSGLVFANIGPRFVALLIDGIIMGVFNFALQIMLMIPITAADPSEESMLPIIMMLVTYVLSTIASASYETFFVGRFAGTPGKLALGLRVVRSDGGRVSYARACGRYFAKIVSYLILYIGFIMAFFDEEKRTLHDRMCDTRVVKV